ncbi:MAG: galactose mutarotase [Prolixibacteraceae bacterium]|nr:galactose mutarotase [Prolixibacteraceae bacterium]
MKQVINLFLAVSILFLLGSCNKTGPFTETANNIKVESFNKTIDGANVSLYELKGTNGIAMKVTNYGARVVALCVPDKNGNPVDVALGYNSVDEYINNTENFFGAAIGRYGNRIGDAKFSLDSVEYILAANDGKNHLHGGVKGYCDVVWNANQVSDSKIEFTYLSVDGEEGYPGNLNIKMTYELTPANEFKIEYKATTDKKTICNLTHHSYFNLSGEGSETINDHILTINADNTTPVDETLIPTGEIVSIKGTPMDFTSPTAIGERADADFQQLKYGKGYDHNWVLNRKGSGIETAAVVESPITGIKMEVLTDQPGIQFYAGNFLDGGVSGKSGKPYKFRSGFCLETQHFPDSPNKPQFPSVVLEPDQEYYHVCIYKFSSK